MAVKWHSTNFPGVRYYKHKTRKNGVAYDRYFAIRYQREGKRKEEGLGWATDGWTAASAFNELSALKRAHKKGKSETTMAEKRQKVKEVKEKKARDEITFSDFFTETYFPLAKSEKAFKSHDRERGLFENWINPVIGNLAFKNIAPIHLEKIKKNMATGKSSPRSIQYCLAVIRQVFNSAYRNGVYSGDNPVKKVKVPKVDNRRMRFFTQDEAKRLMDRLHAENRTMWEVSLISLHCGLRAKEILKLRWIDINISDGLIQVAGKGEKTRFAHMTGPVKDMLLSKDIGTPDALLFPDPDGGIRKEIPRTFARVVKDMGFNNGVTLRKDRAVFHTLRHTYASWLVQSGEDIYVVQKLLGHSTLAMTERYSHLSPQNREASVSKIEKIWDGPENDNVVSITEKVKA
jgi:site-specific recombinase XerD